MKKNTETKNREEHMGRTLLLDTINYGLLD